MMNLMMTSMHCNDDVDALEPIGPLAHATAGTKLKSTVTPANSASSTQDYGAPTALTASAGLLTQEYSQ